MHHRALGVDGVLDTGVAMVDLAVLVGIVDDGRRAVSAPAKVEGRTARLRPESICRSMSGWRQSNDSVCT